MIGQTIAHYKVTAKLGAGGMGEVYRATDSKLGRDVALKVLPEAFAQDPQRMQRFQREAQVLASLNHSHIAAIYGLEEEQGAASSAPTRALVMELVEGPTLADRIAKGALPVDEALPIARQVAEALEYAHERGIIHRDLKPANIKLTADGQVKVLDFGLAKALAEDPASGIDLANSPTLSLAATKAGVILGTAAYMSPEQAKGKAVDRRADIWSFGVLLYEMLTGRRLYEGETASETLAAVILKDPALDQLPHSTPAAVRHLIARCMRKDHRLRLQSIGDARVVLEEAAHPEMAVPTVAVDSAIKLPSVAVGWRQWLPWTVAGLLVLTLGGLLWRNWTSPPSERLASPRFTVTLPENETLSLATAPAVAISPDGTRMVYTAQLDSVVRLFLRPIDRLQAAPIPGTENAYAPFFSPDGNWVAFFAESKLKKAPLGGGPVVTLAELADNRGGTWAGDTIVYAPNAVGGLFRISANGGQPRELTQLDEKRRERTHRFPRFMPDGRTVLFAVGTVESPDYYDNARIDAVDIQTGERRTVWEGASTATYIPTGHLVFAREGSLFAAPFDPRAMTVTGPSLTLLQGVSGDVTTGAVHFSVSSDGSLFYVPGSPASGDLLARMNRSGKVEPLPAPQRTYLELSLSPDGRRAAVVVGAISEYDIWIYDLARGTLSRLTFGGVNRSPRWSADGKWVFYASISTTPEAGGRTELFAKAADGSGQARLVRRMEQLDASRIFLEDVSPDGKWVAFRKGVSGDILMMPVEGEGEPLPLAATPFDETDAVFSPDGRWMVYQSGESGRPEVYVRALGESGGRWQVSNAGGEHARWSRKGKELFYHVGNRMMVVPVQTTPTFQAGTPQLLFDNYFDLRTDAGSVYDVSPDGQWFLAVRPSSEKAVARELRVTLNWFEELKRLVPTGKK